EPESASILNAVYILKNILQRGKPTLASRRLRNAFGYNESEGPTALISQKPLTWHRLIRGDIKTEQYPAKRFFNELIPKYFGEYVFIKQLTIPEVQIFDMTQVYVDRFNNRQVDFYIPQVGLIIEIDGLQHRDSNEIDEGRDAFTRTFGLETKRFTTEEIASENQSFRDKITNILNRIQHVDTLEKQGILNPPNGLCLYHYKAAFSEGIEQSNANVRLTAAIRFQLLLLDLIESGDIRLGEPAHIYLVNQDKIDFANEAVYDLSVYFKELMILLGIEDRALNVQVTDVDEAQAVLAGQGIKVDFSIFERFDDRFQTQPDTIFARTHYFDFYRSFSGGDVNQIECFSLEDYDYFEIACTQPITYHLDLSPDSRQRDALRFFLSNIFLPWLDDVDFREGQIGIIGSALARKGTIGLLPTGSGKSICYQLSAILQPAVSFVVCPIKSLMYDQKADLDAIGFTRCSYITSDLKPDQKAKVQNNYGRGKYFFVFISPERFQTRKFRNEMRAIGLDRSFAYAVIDEAHCLSEWGHDFRTSYLNLSNAINRLAPDARYLGLTATASVNVLKDIQTEFGVPDENVRTPLDFSRDELTFHVLDDNGRKRDKVVSLVREMETKWNAHANAKAGIIFTPTVNGDKGCFSLAGLLSQKLSMEVHYFSGSPPQKDRMHGDAFEAYKQSVQRGFKANKYRLLTATKAFGMGVNKGNIAYTIHFGIPGSMEALYQEAGRAGRDKILFKDQPADCFVLLTKEKNTEALDKIWDASAKVSDLKTHLDKLSRESDINTNLWLMTNSLDTINDEYKLIAKIHAYLEQHCDTQTLTLSASQFGSDKLRFERAIYRLSQLGIISDWVVEDFFKGILEVEFSCTTELQLRNNIEATIRKYEPTFSLSDLLSSTSEFYEVLNERLKKGILNQTQYMFLVLLVWSYDHFVYNRRQSLKTVYETCGDLAAGFISEHEFKLRLEGYFKFNNSTLLLHSLAENASDIRQWMSVFFEEKGKNYPPEIVSPRQLITLKEQLSRFLESYKDNVCLNYISGIMRLASNQFDDADGERRMSRALDQLANHPFEDIQHLVGETLKLKPLMSVESQCRFARLLHEKFPEQRILEQINAGFEDPYTYRKLLEPLLLRLYNVTTAYKGIIW
ncbi:MAG: RecQ family ATP-dependent DNA helicase, partial [Methyloprofundus sp.]|nr:RecQ family ATP-dependent DNA helicase [Methyloprofundus sp.]